MANLAQDMGAKVGGEFKAHRLAREALETKVDAKQDYYEQSLKPVGAKSGDIWKDIDDGTIAMLYIDNGTEVWMEI